jgi:hypothetical protein
MASAATASEGSEGSEGSESIEQLPAEQVKQAASTKRACSTNGKYGHVVGCLPRLFSA